MLPSDDPRVLALTRAVHAGDVEAAGVLLRQYPELATDPHGDAQLSRTALHIATDWPGNFPRVAETIPALVAAGAPVDGRFAGPHTETPLHWAASSDDVAAIDALLEAAADLNLTSRQAGMQSDSGALIEWLEAQR